MLTQYELTVDSAEQPVEHPSDQKEQKTLYSRKNKNHTLKNQLTVLPNGKDIVGVKIGDPGSTSDISQLRAHLSQFCDIKNLKETKVILEKSKYLLLIKSLRREN
ncbi:transposase family protein [Microcoleus sp. F8_C2]